MLSNPQASETKISLLNRMKKMRKQKSKIFLNYEIFEVIFKEYIV